MKAASARWLLCCGRNRFLLRALLCNQLLSSYLGELHHFAPRGKSNAHRVWAWVCRGMLCSAKLIIPPLISILHFPSCTLHSLILLQFGLHFCILENTLYPWCHFSALHLPTSYLWGGCICIIWKYFRAVVSMIWLFPVLIYVYICSRNIAAVFLPAGPETTPKPEQFVVPPESSYPSNEAGAWPPGLGCLSTSIAMLPGFPAPAVPQALCEAFRAKGTMGSAHKFPVGSSSLWCKSRVFRTQNLCCSCVLLCLEVSHIFCSTWFIRKSYWQTGAVQRRATEMIKGVEGLI